MTIMTECQVLFRPDSDALRFLPEGPYSLNDGRISWVAIQHGGDSGAGSINILDPVAGSNECFDLPGRPGFAFPTSQPGVFVAGVERSLGLFDTNTNAWTELCGGVDSAVENTIINDGVIYGDNLIFGCKDLKFETKKAGLYLWRQHDRSLIQLRDDQICSNGKAVVQQEDGNLALIDIDSPSKTITRSSLDLASGTVGEPSSVVDVTSEQIFPDGMIITPDGRSLIVAFYDPADPECGVARQYGLDSGAVEAVWTCPGSPRVTCPQLVTIEGRVHLLLTTAVEHMEPEQQQRHPNAGCLFVGSTTFDAVSDQPVLTV
ncbi:MAG: SMP-30/gluconolactonase/LRE family protein [Fuerstiella sp.]|nr:SMP-30/gluconolactonase/LRE family protein [Fuerstiella sp.]MCP4856693.1 SMP-30/gluconolactonase/LRE family protein [Fuerstiella sp.]